MNVHRDVGKEVRVNMTSKGQVLVPKAIRDQIGLIPGESVLIGINDRGEAVVRPARHGLANLTLEERIAHVRASILSVAGSARTGQSTDDYMREIRGDHQP
jgi:AbrB family looped-hinge helix DNA binding protein